ncbi:helix-turn-helix transcriptional regulator [Streptomyces sp. NBC_00209]|uniref:helix-turn-helix transcriptional regulator n=1 Tax=Streptomyces sp. NBC_00209 TaxID=2975682 RepID=UPI003251B4A9
MDTPSDRLLDTGGVAEVAGITPATVRLYLKRTRKRVADGLSVRPADFPLPDGQFGRSPAWREGAIRAWLAVRPGRGRSTPDV